MNRDDLVTHDRRLYFVRGVDPAAIFEPRAYLEDAATGMKVSVALEDLRAGRRLIHGDDPPRGDRRAAS
jgi:hypothetical protein